MNGKNMPQHYIEKLVELGIVVTRGVKKGNTFLLNPKIKERS
jgi:hypothetical protein